MICRKTLLLNQGYQPIKAISWKRAICMHFLEKVEVLENYDWTINSPSLQLSAPAVVRLKYNAKAEPMRIRFSRGNIYARDNKVCQYCNKKFSAKHLTLDHVIPRSLGGRTTWTNIVTACQDCNTKKADKTPQQANMKLLSKPTYPSVQTLYANAIGGRIPEQWNNWLF
jgi:5-methylcytosine-specific restriction endonuclease McrA